jgi:hypothetical protein
MIPTDLSKCLKRATLLAVTTNSTLFPAAKAGKIIQTTTSAWLGGTARSGATAGTGLKVNPGDLFYCNTTNAGGTYTDVGSKWTRIRQAVINDDGDRSVQMAGNTAYTPMVGENSFGFLNNVMFKNENGYISQMSRFLSKTTVSFAADGATTLYTVPTGWRCVLDFATIIAAANAGATTITIGQVGALTDFLDTQTLSNLDAAYGAVTCRVVPNATPVKKVSYAAGTVLQINVGSHAGAAGNTVLLYGSLY